MLAKRGLRQKPTYESLMQTLRTDYPLELPSRDAFSFWRNSIQMTQFDGIGLLDNLDQQEARLQEATSRGSVLNDMASGRGIDYKLIQQIQILKIRLINFHRLYLRKHIEEVKQIR